MSWYNVAGTENNQFKKMCKCLRESFYSKVFLITWEPKAKVFQPAAGATKQREEISESNHMQILQREEMLASRV